MHQIRRNPPIIALLVISLLSGLLAFSSNADCARGKKSDFELLQTATHDLVPELRTAAAHLLTERLQKGPLPAIVRLEELVRGPSAELRHALVRVLQQAYFQALQSGRLSLQELVAEIPQGETFELRLARAAAAINYLLWSSLNRELAGELLRLLGGDMVEISGYRFDGALRAVRLAVYAQLQIYLRQSELLWVHSCRGWEGSPSMALRRNCASSRPGPMPAISPASCPIRNGA